MYKKEGVTISELFKQGLTKERSEKALRARATEGILVSMGLGEDGRSVLYDKQLTVARAIAARNCKNTHTSVKWGTFKRTLKRLDTTNPSLNETIIGLYSNGNSQSEAIEKVEGHILNQLRTDGHLE